jgi:DNA helicase HerA-like ATPase
MIDTLTRDAILKVGEVSEIDGRKIFIKVDKNKNLSEIFIDGDILTNISVNSYIEIRKGFLSIIGKVDGEKLEEEIEHSKSGTYERINKNKRHLSVSLVGYINQDGRFVGGTKELPLIGNEAYIITKEKISLVHNIAGESEISINIATTDSDDLDIAFPVDGLFNSHIAIFGNTGSGKSNTLAYLYQELYKALNERNAEDFKENSRFILFDFNGEYARPSCISTDKKVYNLSTRVNANDKIPISTSELLNVEILSVLADATEKTQKPFLRRAISLYDHVMQATDTEDYLRNIVRRRIKDILQMSDKIRADLLLDYLQELLPKTDANGNEFDARDGLEWHNNVSEFKLIRTNTFLRSTPEAIENTSVYLHAASLALGDDPLARIIKFLYLQLIQDVLSNRAQNDHIAPAINKLKSKQRDIEKIFSLAEDQNFWESNFVVINLNDVNLDMKKTIPLLVSKKEYSEHKSHGNSKSLNIIIDEAHNILSRESFRESESWKDYRLETFEEIIKEGRKFGVFVTISSQRPNDISSTITSQAHNYFIHRLINQKDLETIANAVSYIDRMTEASIPSLPTGTCIFSGVASQIPLKINVRALPENLKPKNDTLKFSNIIPVSLV